MTAWPREVSVVRREVVDLLCSASRPLITGHELADGDVLGSAVALFHGLVALGKTPTIAVNEPFVALYSWLAPSQGVRVLQSEFEAGLAVSEADLIVVVDNNAWERLGYLRRPVSEARVPVLCIDHHPTSTPFSAHHLLDIEAAATTLIIFDLLQDLGVALEKKMANALYAGIVNDTGWFQNSNTDVRTFGVCQALLAAGLDPHLVARSITQTERIEGKRLKARFLASVELHRGGAIALGMTRQADFAATGALPEESEHFIQELRSLRGVELSVFLREDKDQIKISLRSIPGRSARRVALQFGGGGHEVAAGGRHPGPLDRARLEVLLALAEELDRVS